MPQTDDAREGVEERLREALREAVVHMEYDFPGDVPEPCGMWCQLCREHVDDDKISGHRADCLLATPATTETAASGEGRFWIIVHEPGLVPNRKGPWHISKAAETLRELIKARPTAYLHVLTIDSDGTPDVEHGPEVLQMLDGRSMGTGRKHNARTRVAHSAALAPQRAVGREEIATDAARDVLSERKRQVEAEGVSSEHDDEHVDGEIAAAAAAYAFAAAIEGRYLAADPLGFWPWEASSWKPSGARRNLVKAGALILAEIERLDRLNPPAVEGRAKGDGA